MAGSYGPWIMAELPVVTAAVLEIVRRWVRDLRRRQERHDRNLTQLRLRIKYLERVVRARRRQQHDD